MHNLQLNEDQDLIVDTVRKFTADVVAKHALDHDEHRAFARAEYDGLAELGVFGLSVGEAGGGAAMGLLPFVAAVEVIGEHSGSLARLFTAQVQSALALEAAGGAGLDGIVAGSTLAVFVGPEHGITCANGMLSGGAELVPGGGEAGLFVVAATASGEPVLATCGADGVQRTALRSLGLASSAPARLRFTGAATVVARGAAAAAAIARAQLIAWVGGAAAAVGGGNASIAAARKHAGERIAFGKPLLVQQAVVRKLVEARQRVEAARHLTWHAARIHDLGQDASEAAMQARVQAVDAVVQAADEAIQIHGGFGYTVEYHVERHYRDGKTLEVLDGGSEALRDRLGLVFA